MSYYLIHGLFFFGVISIVLSKKIVPLKGQKGIVPFIASLFVFPLALRMNLFRKQDGFSCAALINAVKSVVKNNGRWLLIIGAVHGCVIAIIILTAHGLQERIKNSASIVPRMTNYVIGLGNFFSSRIIIQPLLLAAMLGFFVYAVSYIRLIDSSAFSFKPYARVLVLFGLLYAAGIVVSSNVLVFFQ